MWMSRRKNSRPWFRFFPSDWRSGCAGLSVVERGVYISILTIIYDEGGPVSRDDKRLARECGTTVTVLKKSLDGLVSLGKLVIGEDGCISNFRAAFELNERAVYESTQSENATSRWKKDKQNQQQDDAAALPMHNFSDAVVMPARARPQPHPHPQKKDKEETRARALDPPDDWPNDFRDQFWSQYPHRVGRAAAVVALERVRKRQAVTWAALTAGLSRYVAKTDDRPWCNPATWLNQARWDDVPAAVGPKHSPRGPPRPSLIDLAISANAIATGESHDTPGQTATIADTDTEF